MSVEYFDEQRRQLIAAIRAHTEQVATRIGKTALDKQVLRAMTKVHRHEFVPAEVQSCAYLDTPLPIGFGKTISQPISAECARAAARIDPFLQALTF
jgi:protein-L-isoaspartate(D-aspartate) O-methyltransferase